MNRPARAMNGKILIIEDEPSMLLGLEHNLKYEGYAVVTAATGRSGLEAWRRERPDLVLLDVMLPEMDGFEILQAIRSEDAQAPVILLTAKGLETDKVHGLTLGADDYVTKPFSIRELLARVQAVLRRTRSEGEPATVVTFGDVEVNFQRRECRRGGREIQLSFKEFEVLQLLIQHRGETVTREALLEAVWGKEPGDLPTSRTVDTHIANLRRKVEGGDEASHIRTVHKVGYKFVAEPDRG